MAITIGSLNGLFTGTKFLPGPISIDVAHGKINAIRREMDKSADISGEGKIAIPPFCDGHTHAIFAGTRYNELGMKLAGKSYSDILAQGGGIQRTVSATRMASDEELLELLLSRLDKMLANGSLNVEIKSGYGLNTEHELRLLRITNKANQMHPIEVTPTFGAAHVIPHGKKSDDYVKEIVEDMLPVVKHEKLATTTDVFCDRGAFTVEDTRKIFEASSALDIPVRVHAEELEYTGIGKLAAQTYSALSADHLLLATKEDFEVLAAHKTVAMFMPVAPLGLFSSDRPSGYLESGVTLGLGSDFNPNNWVISMQTAIRMAVFLYKIAPEIALKAATMGSYEGIKGKAKEPVGAGFSADFLLIDSLSIDEFVSKIGQNLVTHVFKNGTLIHKNT